MYVSLSITLIAGDGTSAYAHTNTAMTFVEDDERLLILISVLQCPTVIRPKRNKPNHAV